MKRNEAQMRVGFFAALGITDGERVGSRKTGKI